MKTTWKIAIAAGIAAVGLAVLAAAPFTNPKVQQALNLTPEQQQKMKDLRYQHQKEMIKFREDVSLKRLDLQRELDKDSPDRATADRLADEMSAIRARMGRARIDHLLDARKVLTPEQWSKARELMQARRAQRMKGRGGRGAMSPGSGQRWGRGGRGQGFGANQGSAPEGTPGEDGGEDLPAPGF